MQTKPLDVREVITNMAKMPKRLLPETITLQFEPPAELPLVQGDAGMIEQVLMNLVVNARDAMPNGGTLTVNIQLVPIDATYTQMHPEATTGDFVCLRVSDTGSGMDSYTMGRIFEPFFTTKEVGKGTGLGLATVYGIVKQHGGWLEVASELGKGTVFTVFFPATTDRPETRATVSPTATAITGGSETILVVEDEPVLRDMAQIILKDCGYEVLGAGSGNEALQVWDRHQGPIHLVLTDMVMPEGMTGIDLAKRLRATQPRLKIILASGYSTDDMDTDFMQQAGALFLQKHYTHCTLTKAVRECLDKKPADDAMTKSE